MAWYTEYYHEWYSDDETLLRLNFKKTTSGSMIEMEGQPDPITIMLPTNDRFEVVRATGATLNLMSTTDMQFSNPGFIGDDPKEWLVEYLEDGTPMWFGYLERKMYTEPYTEVENYPITLYVQDGFNLLGRIRFTDAGVPYRGTMTQWEIIKLILEKWGLMDQVTLVHVGLSTYSRQIWYLDENYNHVLEGVFVKMENYIDEDGMPMTCREVLDTILKPYGAIIQRQGTEIYIYDINGLAGGGDDYPSAPDGRSVVGWTTTYDNTFVLSGAGSTAPGWSDVYDHGIYRRGGKFSVYPNYKGLTINYSRYRDSGIDTQFDNTDTFHLYNTQSQAWVHDTGGDDDYWYQYVDAHDEWLFQDSPITSDGALILGLIESESREPEYMISITNPNFDGFYNPGWDFDSSSIATSSFSYNTPTTGPYIIGTEDHYLRIKGQIRARSRTDPFNSETGEDVHQGIPGSTSPDAFRLGVRIFIGTKEFSCKTNTWVDDAAKWHMNFCGGSIEPREALDTWSPIKTLKIEHTGRPWVWANRATLESYKAPLPATSEEGVLIALSNDVRGYVTMSFTSAIQGHSYDKDYVGFGSTIIPEAFVQNDNVTVACREVHLKDIVIDVVRKGDLSEQHDDIEYEANTTSSWTDHMGTIQLKHGTSDTVGSPIDRAGLLKPVLGYSWWDEFKREGQSNRLEKLLASSIASNFSGSIKGLDITLNSASPTASFTLSDVTYHSGSIFLTTGFEMNPTKRSCKYELAEIRRDELQVENQPHRRARRPRRPDRPGRRI